MTVPITTGKVPLKNMPSNIPHDGLVDNFGRRITYVRLSVTDRCNLRCAYCMPEKMRFLPKDELLTFPEMERLMRLLASMGVRKVRITGGEPFVRPGLIDFLRRLREIPGIERIHITTNGVLTGPLVPDLKALGIAGVNLSLDTLNRERFRQITRRDEFAAVMDCFHKCLEYQIPMRINCVLMEGQNEADLIPLAELTRDHPVAVRFIEEMPFNGTKKGQPKLYWNYQRILEKLRSAYPCIYKIADEPASTSINYGIPGHQGTVGIIAGFSRTFCGTCNRIRITAKGTLQTCLYGKGVLSVRDLLRYEPRDEAIKGALIYWINRRFKDGWEAQKYSRTESDINESMSLIGG